MGPRRSKAAPTLGSEAGPAPKARRCFRVFPKPGRTRLPLLFRVPRMEMKAGLPPAQGLYDPRHEHDACGVGFVAHIKGRKSHDIVAKGLTILNNLRHRGATGADPLHGDGAGLLVQIPDAFFREEMGRQGVKLPKAGAYGVGMIFLPRNPAARAACVREIERAIANEGQTLLGWRKVPVDDSSLGETARGTMPVISQVFVGAGRGSLDRPRPRHPRARAFERGRLLRAVVLAPHHRLQGDAARRAGRSLLPRRDRQALRLGALPRPPALLHQHVPDVGPGASLPLHRAQRRDQHAAREFELDQIAPGDDPLEAARRRPRQDLAAHLRRAVGLGFFRQRARAPRDGRLPDRARDDADDSRGVGRQSADGREAQSLLRIPRRFDGTVGRPRGRGVHRWQVHRRHPRPQRASSRALFHHRR